MSEHTASPGELTAWMPALIAASIGTVGAAVLPQIFESVCSPRLLPFWLAALLIVAGEPIVRDIRRRKFDVFELRNVIAFCVVFYVVPLPLSLLIAASPTDTDASTRAVSESVVLCTLALLVFNLAYQADWGVSLASRLPRIRPESISRLKTSTMVAVAVIASMFLVFIVQIGGLGTYLSAGYVELYQIEQGHEHFAFAVNMFPACLLLLYHLSVRARSVRWWVFTAVLMMSFGSMLVLVGKRRLLVTLAIAFLVYRHYAQKRITAKKLLALIVLGAVGVSALGLVRALPAAEIFSGSTIDFLKAFSWSELLYTFLQNGEFAVTYESFPTMVDAIHEGLPHAWGKTYLLAPAVLIPRILYPNRPATMSEWYTEHFFPEISDRLGGRALFFLTEPYWNFGVIGPLLFMLVAGVAARLVTAFLHNNRTSGPAALIYAAAAACIPSGIRIDFAVFLKGALIATLAVVLIVVWYSTRPSTDMREVA